MKINYTMYGLGIGGGTRTIFELASHLSRRGHEVSITTLERGRKIRLSLDKHVKVYQPDIPILIKLFDPFFYIRSRGEAKTNMQVLEQVINKAGIDVHIDFDRELYKMIPECDISAATLSLSAFPTYYGKGTAKVYHMQHFETHFFNDEYEKKRVLESYRLPMIRIANSSWLKNKLAKELGVDSIFVPWGINTKIFNTKKINSQRLNGMFKRENNEIYVMSLGRSDRWKGLPDLFEALKYIRKKMPNLNIKLVLYGKQPYLKDNSPIDCEYVLNPTDKELVYLYQNCDVSVTASFYESFPLPPLEAMACGSKVVTTPYGVEDYAKDGYNCIIVKPQDSKSIADGIIRAVTDFSTDKFRRTGPQTAKKFTWERAVNSIEKIYKDALK